MLILKQSTAITLKMGPFLDNTDGDTVEGALAIAQADVRLSKNGGNFAQKNDAGAGVYDEGGWYDIPLNATDTNTLGRLVIYIHEAGALQVWERAMVMPAQEFESLFGTDVLQVDLTQWLGVAPLALNAQRVQTHLGATDAGAIVAATFAANAISAAAFAQAAADKVWATAARTLTSFGTLVNDVADQVWDELRAGHVGAGSFGQGIASVQGNVTGSVGSVTGNVGGNVVGTVASVVGNVGGNVVGDVQGDVLGNVIGTVASVVGNVGGNVVGTVASVVGNVGGNVVGTIGDLAAAARAAVNAEVDTALADIDLDHFIQVAAGAENPTIDSYLDQIMNKDGAQTFSPATDSLEAIRDNMTTPPTVGAIADAVWDEMRAGHVLAGSFGQGVASVQGNVTGSVASVVGDVGGNVVGTVASVVGNVGGNVVGTVASVVGNVGGNVVGSVASMLSAGRNQMADSILSRPISNVDGTAVFRSLAGGVGELVNRVAQVAGNLIIYQTDDLTVWGTRAITEDATANPIVALDTV